MPNSANCANFRSAAARVPESSTIAPMHLRWPSIDHGLQSFAWAVLFFLILWFGMLAVGVSGATAFILSLVCGGAIFLFVRLTGEDVPGRR
jgi:hypothetical protein